MTIEPDDVRENMREAGYLKPHGRQKRGAWIAVLVLVIIGAAFLGPLAYFALQWWFGP